MRPSGRPRGSGSGRIKVTTLNLMTACRANVSPSPLSSSLRLAGSRATMLHIGGAGQQPIAQTVRAQNTTARAGRPRPGDFPPRREDTGKIRFQAAPEAALVAVSH